MTTGKYPAIWTNSTIHPIFKNGYKNSPSNYRGIALISNVSKLFTSILRSRLEEWVEGRRVIPENQAGFRKGRSCIDHIFTLTTLIQLSLRKKRGKLYVFFVDLRKAFDTVPHSILWKKLYNLGISYQFISTIRSYYEQATIAIRWKGSFTESIKINSGVLQGEPLSSLLFILFITDLIEIYNNSDLPSVNLPEFGDIHLLLYADIIAIIVKELTVLNEKKIENLLDIVDTPEMIDQTVKELTNMLIEAAHNSLKVNNNMTTKNNISNKWWNTNLQLLKDHCHYLRNCYYRNKNCPNHIKQYYESIRNKYLREIEKARKASWRIFLEENKSNNPYGNLYKVYKNIKSGSNRKRNMQILEGNTDMECLQKGEELLNNLFPDDKCEEDTNIRESIRNYNLKLLNKEKPMVMITEVNDLIDKLNPKKSPGIDNISSNMIRHTKQFIAPILVKLFQKCLDLQYYPAEWKRAEAIIIPKPGKTDFNNYKNYRPLCLNSNISKIF
ncbi:hypothetical protein LAZ67_10003138 [Cordylochernes scorpioides]|uniref:Reverse transcriptase domain-containing protein n=1 Tax=Cordylochernes scorpioides TaxID=51811 RepID=A0ABY6KX21_9ARAC|nr:hypothetical protein LAZ67_10003138 [Cordylochernes scorpioides]